MQRGFSLIELLVVLVVLSVLVSLVSFSVSAFGGHALESAAANLATSLEQARWQAISTQQRIAWEAPGATGEPQAQWHSWQGDEQNGQWRPLHPPLPTPDLAGAATVIAQTTPPASNARARIVLGPEPVVLASCVLLTQDGRAMTVESDGVSPFTVKRHASCP